MFSVFRKCCCAATLSVGNFHLSIGRAIVYPGKNYSQMSSGSMQAWQAYEYGSPDVLQLTTSPSVPAIRRPIDVLVKVHAASVNPLDVMMLKGYGSTIFYYMRGFDNFTFRPQQFPLTLGRDFSGTIVNIGSCVNNVKVGDEVFGIVGPERQGSHATYVSAPSYCVAKKPLTLSHVEAASLPYASLTAWSALCTFGGLSEQNAYGKRVAVFGGSGGVGSIAIQLLKSWGAEVTATCSTDAVEMVRNLGADEIIDYQMQDLRMELRNTQKFDFILDTVGAKDNKLCVDALKKWKGSRYVTIVSPLLQNADDYGVILGTAKSFFEASMDTVSNLKDGRSVRWAYVMPNMCALKKISEMAEQKQIKPVVEKVFKFEEAAEAYRKLLDGHARGKTVIDFTSSSEENIEPVYRSSEESREEMADNQRMHEKAA